MHDPNEKQPEETDSLSAFEKDLNDALEASTTIPKDDQEAE